MTQQDSTNIGYVGRALEKLGFEQKILHLSSTEFRQFNYQGKMRWLTTISPALSYPTTHNAIRMLSRDKTLANSFVQQLGFSVPISVTQDLTEGRDGAHDLLENVGKVIVKPNVGSMSRGLTLDVTDHSQLDKALDALIESDDAQAVVQQQVHGEEIRFAVIDGEMKAAVLRQAAQVIGDGTSSVAELIKKEDVERSKIVDTAVTYPFLSSILETETLSRSDVPEKGAVVKLATGTMIRTGASMYDITSKIDASYKLIVESIARSIPSGFIVIDLLVVDYMKNTAESPYWFIEFNTSPVLKLFYSCRDGNHFDTATHLAEYIFKATREK